MPLPSKSLDAVKRLWPALKWGVFLLVLVFVTRHGWQLWKGFDQHATPLNWGWLLLAIATSLIAWLPSLWYWRKLMSALGANAPWPQAARAYYCGHLGKYVPGKGAAIVIRSALLKDCDVPGTTAALTVTIEALTCIWVGSLLAIGLFPTLAPGMPPSIAAAAAYPILPDLFGHGDDPGQPLSAFAFRGAQAFPSTLIGRLRDDAAHHGGLFSSIREDVPRHTTKG